MHEPQSTAAHAAHAEDETLSERGPVSHETSRVGHGAVVAQLLSDVRRTLDAAPPGKARRMLMPKLEALQFAVDCWPAIPPRAEQLSAMLEALLKLQEAASEVA